MPEQPNIVMVTWDSVRADHTPMYGYERNTCPFVNEMAQEGIVFDDTYVSAVGTPASFSGVFTGEHTSGVHINATPEYWQAVNQEATLLPEVLQREGYHTGGFHFNALMSRHFGWGSGWDVYEDYLWGDSAENGATGVKGVVFDTLQKVGMANFAVHFKKMLTGEMTSRWEAMWPDIESFVEEAPEPWFLWVLLIDTHHPWYAPVDYHAWDQRGVRATYAMNYIMRRRRSLVGTRNRKIVNSYDNTMRYADAFVERLWQKVRSAGYDETAFIFHSDHGDELGEHANYGHRPLMFDTLTRVPLVMWNVDMPGASEGPNTLLDLGNQILEFAGSETRLGEGKTLREDRDTVTVQNLLGEYGRCVAAVDGAGWKTLYHPEGDWGHGGIDPGFAAYNRRDDPMELDDRWGEHPQELEDALLSQLGTDAEDITSTEGDIGRDVQERLSELGYLE